MSDDYSDFDNIHPKIRERREASRESMAFIEVFDDSSIRVWVHDNIESPEQKCWVLKQVDYGKEELEKLMGVS